MVNTNSVPFEELTVYSDIWIVALSFSPYEIIVALISFSSAVIYWLSVLIIAFPCFGSDVTSFPFSSAIFVSIAEIFSLSSFETASANC
jgi:hypothetical protein